MTDPKEPETVAEWFEKGVQCFRDTDGVNAVNAFRRVIEMAPSYRHSDGDNAYFYMGKIHEVEGDMDKALTMYGRALEIDPWDEESLIGRGSCLTVKRDHDGAIADFRKVLEIPDQHRRAPRKHLFYAIAENFRQKKDYAAALEWGRRALADDPDNFRHQELVKDVTARMAESDG